jgi:ferredoxin
VTVQQRSQPAQLSRREFLFGRGGNATVGRSANGLGVTDIHVAESCTLCGACVDKCPHKALAIREGNLLFYAANCTGCGYCEEICPERSITLSEAVGLNDLGDKSVYQDEMVKCSTCGTPYASAKMICKISAILPNDKSSGSCPACREKGAYQELLSNLTPKG